MASFPAETRQLLGSYEKIMQLMKSMTHQRQSHSIDESCMIDSSHFKDIQNVQSHINSQQIPSECGKFCLGCEKLMKNLELFKEKYGVLKIETYASDLTIFYLKWQNQQLLKKLAEAEENSKNPSTSEFFCKTTKENSCASEADYDQQIEQLKGSEVYGQMIDTFNPQELKKILHNEPVPEYSNQLRENIAHSNRKQFKLKEFKLNAKLRKGSEQSRKYKKTASQPILIQQSVQEPEEMDNRQNFKFYYS